MSDFYSEVVEFISDAISRDSVDAVLKEASLVSLDFFGRPIAQNSRKRMEILLGIIHRVVPNLLPEEKAREFAFYVMWYVCGPMCGMARTKYPIELKDSFNNRKTSFSQKGLVHQCFVIESKSDCNLFEDNSVPQVGHGLCINDPIRLKSITLAYAYLDQLISPYGTPFVHSNSHMACKGLSGHIVDAYPGHYVDEHGKNKTVAIYIDSYSSENVLDPPDGWSLRQPPVSNKVKCKRGCLLPFMLILGSFLTICVCIFSV